MGRLLASAPTIEAMQTIVRRFYLSDEWTVTETLQIIHSDGHSPTGVQVRKSGKRYRLEMV